MDKYINLELANTVLDNISIAGADGILTFNDGVEFAKDILNNMSPNGTIDVIRCEDCECWNPETSGCDRIKTLVPFRNWDFCSYGERKTDNE